MIQTLIHFAKALGETIASMIITLSVFALMCFFIIEVCKLIAGVFR